MGGEDACLLVCFVFFLLFFKGELILFAIKDSEHIYNFNHL